jgi:uncharacterized protein (DUF1778 family)
MPQKKVAAKKRRSTTSFRIPEEIMVRLKKAAELEHTSMNTLVIRFVRDGAAKVIQQREQKEESLA